jgi:hypothetical protein
MNTLTSKSLALIALFICCASFVAGQSKLANEWLDVNKTYYKLNVAKDGIYRVKFEQLAQAGFPQNVRSADLRLVNIGVEEPIFVSSTNTFGPGDFIEFYGEAHTIGVDSFLYQDWKMEMFNPRFSLTSDSNAYFLTVSPETSNARMSNATFDFSTPLPTAAQFCLFEENIVFKNKFFKTKISEVYQSLYEPTEGFGGDVVGNSIIKLSAKNQFINEIKPIIRFRLGNNGFFGKLTVNFNNDVLDTLFIDAKQNLSKAYLIPAADLLSENTLTITNIFGDSDKHRMAFATLTYPRKLEFDNASDVKFTMPATQGKRYLQIKKGFGTGFAYDINRNIRYKIGVLDGSIQLVINGATSVTNYFIPNKNDTISSITQFKPVSFADNSANYIILSHPDLQGSEKAVDQYAAYRSSPEGGNYKTSIVNIEDLYNNFAYGAKFHSISIKNFSDYMVQKWPQAKFVMILGKGLEYRFMRNNNDVINNEGKNFFVPTFGSPGSDVLLFSLKNDHVPRFATGRLAAKTPTDILDYLDKIKTYESAPFAPQTVEDKLWMKKVLHLGGGKTVSEQSEIKFQLESFGAILSDTTFGGHIKSFYKNNADNVQFSVNQEINDIMNSGISILNFFGHSASTSWEFSLQKAENFKNKDRYPFITSFGCYSGNLHDPSTGISESFIIQPQKAAIGFYASTGTAFAGDLGSYGRNFYDAHFRKHIGKTIGDIIKLLAEDSGPVQDNRFALFTQLTYHGDPALKLYADAQPDYTFDFTSIKTEPTAIQTATQEFKINLNMINLGRHQRDTVDLIFYHQLPGGKYQDTIEMRLASAGAITPVTVTLRNNGLEGLGRNVLYGIIDPKNTIIEEPLSAAEQNNEIKSLDGTKGFEFYISDNVATPIYPANYAMINTADHFILKASTPAAPLAETRYVIEMDTTRYFDSPAIERTAITSIGGYLEYKPAQSPRVNQVYYWRISPDSLPNSTYKWSQSSFAYLPNEAEGWNQSHFFQFTDDKLTDLSISEETNRNFEFLRESFFVNVKNKFWDPNNVPGYTRNNITFGSVSPWNYMTSGLAFVVFDPKKDYLRNASGGQYGSLNPNSSSIAVFPFETGTPEKRKNIVDFLNTFVKDEQIVCVFSIVKDETADLKVEDWEMDKAIYGTSIFEALESRGATRIKDMKTSGTVPYIFQFEVNKDRYVVLDEVIALVKNETITSNVVFDGLYKKNGNIKSTLIGPASSWGDLKFNISEKNDLKEKGWVNIIGIQENGEEKTIDSFLVQNKSLTNLPSLNFPYLKIQEFNRDSTALTSAQLDFWRISYQGFPDAAISVTNESFPATNKIEQGNKLSIRYKIKNTTTLPMDSILVKYILVDSNNKSIENYRRLGKLGANAEISDTYEWTIDMSFAGLATAIIEINPNQDQPELHYFNNRILYKIDIARDEKNPNLLVYFDGIQILDGDIVSPKPEIKITLKDDNLKFPITSADNFEMSIDTGFNQFKIIPMSNPNIKFVPANATNGEAHIIYTPTLADGDYILIVQGKDAAGNLSGVNPRTVNFTVITEQTITEVLNYPNPFSNSTEFIFTLTGEEVPDQVSISIMTLSGKVVKEITKEELGPLRIGVNRTAYKWNGTDEYGEKLANGVYLYRVNFRDAAGQSIKKRDDDKLSTFFKHGIGKLVILR